MSWSTSTDVRGFLAEAGEFLRSRPVEHTVLLTESAYLQARPRREGQLFGWWHGADGRVAGAFLQAPNHAPVLSAMPADAVDSLAGVLTRAETLDVDARLAETLAAAWKHRVGRDLAQRTRITLHRLTGPVEADQPAGKARVAVAADRETLLHWYDQMMARFPGDPSEAEYVVDDPITHSGITIWEVRGEPVAMAGRSRLVAGMVRLGAVYALGDNHSHAQAAFAAACRAAAGIADHVLTFAPAGKPVPGFQAVLDRVTLTAIS